ncbi:hypothetical protein CH381_08320 [Leptospira sp. mixed culture ATI2-C-A1]|nr:hypothetical protein CH381_08320 [Leptospira sp. mixed culture ATI2-C-A1]
MNWVGLSTRHPIRPIYHNSRNIKTTTWYPEIFIEEKFMLTQKNPAITPGFLAVRRSKDHFLYRSFWKFL